MAAKSAGSGSPGSIADTLAHARRVLTVDPDNAAAIARLEEALRTLGHSDWEDRALRMRNSLLNPQLQQAARLLADGKLGAAERVLRPYLAAKPEDTAALRLMADLAERVGRPGDAEMLLRRAVAIDDDYVSARYDLASLLIRELKLVDAVSEVEELLRQQPNRLEFLILKATTLERLGRNEEALSVFAEAARLHPSDASVWLKAGHVARTTGRLEESIGNYRNALTLSSSMGAAWWSLANLKVGVLNEQDVDAMILALGQDDLPLDDRLHIHFALGKATEDLGCYREAFTHYSEGNRLRRSTRSYDPDAITSYVDRTIAVLGEDFARSLAVPGGDAGLVPIFVIGMPRAGSTLVEQILASHPAIEGTSELHYMPRIASRAGFGKTDSGYPERLLRPGGLSVAELAEEYLKGIAGHCRLDRLMVIDKNPNNWLHIPLILRLLPQAKIVDVRRNPLDCGMSNFKQHFAQGQGFSYSLAGFGRYYRDYVRMLDHWSKVLPGRIHHVRYERLVDETEDEVRRLLSYLGVGYDAACLSFYRNERPVRTPSSEQVRRPINRDGIGQWQVFAPWLDELRHSLGPGLGDEESAFGSAGAAVGPD